VSGAVERGQEETSRGVVPVEVLRDVADGRNDRRELLKIAGGRTIICLLDGASLRSPREDAGGIPSGLNLRNRSARPRLTF